MQTPLVNMTRRSGEDSRAYWSRCWRDHRQGLKEVQRLDRMVKTGEFCSSAVLNAVAALKQEAEQQARDWAPVNSVFIGKAPHLRKTWKQRLKAGLPIKVDGYVIGPEDRAGSSNYGYLDAVTQFIQGMEASGEREAYELVHAGYDPAYDEQWDGDYEEEDWQREEALIAKREELEETSDLEMAYIPF